MTKSLILEEWLPFRFFTLAERVGGLLASYYSPKYGLSRAAWRVMAVAANHPGISAKEICRIAGLDQFAVSRAIGQLVEFGFARRQSAKNDRRYIAIELSAKGATAHKDIAQIALLIDQELMALIDRQEAELLEQLLSRLEYSSASLHAKGWRNLEGAQASLGKKEKAAPMSRSDKRVRRSDRS